MQAVGIGDCLVHCNDSFGRPCQILIKDVLHVPLRVESHVSVCYGSISVQTVLPSVHAVKQQPCYVPFKAQWLITSYKICLLT